MAKQNEFDQAAYWRDRHEKLNGDPRSVGNLSATIEANQQGEAALKSSISRVAAVLKDECSSVLDLGCGYGRTAQPWIDMGYNYTGVDVSETALHEARKRSPRGKFVCADLNRWAPTHGYDVVAILYVLVHFVDDTDWRRFLNVSMLATQKYLVIGDHFPASREQPAPHVVSRPLSDYVPLLEEGGLRLDWAIRDSLSEIDNIRQLVFARRAS